MYDSKSSANSKKDTCRCASGRPSSHGSHWSSESHRSMASIKSGPHFQSLGSCPSSGSFVGHSRGKTGCNWCRGDWAWGALRCSTGNRRQSYSFHCFRARSTAKNMQCSWCTNCSSGFWSSCAQ